MNIVILGSPASGKGTQAELIAKEFNLFHFQTGDLARELAEKDARIREIVDSGKLVPENEMTIYALDYLHKKKSDLKDILFEGFPRFISQYEALENFLRAKGDDIDAVISLEISQEEAIRRISARRVCSSCGKTYNLVTNPPPSENICTCGGELVQRKDDSPESVEVRFEYYKENTKELIDYLGKEGKLIIVDGERPIDVIFEDIKKRLEAINGQNK